MAWVGLVIMVASAVMQKQNQDKAAKAEQEAAEAQANSLDRMAKQGDQIAGQRRATAQRGAFAQREKKKLIESRALSVGAASGANVSDPGFVNLVSDIDAEGEYRALSVLFEGEQEARSLEDQSALRRFEADQTRRAGVIRRDIAEGAANAQFVGSIGSAVSGGFGGSSSAKAPKPTTTTTGVTGFDYGNDGLSSFQRYG